MNGVHRREIWALLIGAVAAVISALIGVFLDLPKTLKFAGDASTWAVVITVTIPILIMLAANQISQIFKDATLREQTIEELIRMFPHAAAIVHFDSSAEAINYIIGSLDRAEKFYNTRLTTPRVERSDELNVQVTSELDHKIEERLKGGMDYFWLVSDEFSDEAKSLKEARKKMCKSGRSVGSYVASIITKAYTPQLHFCVIDYGTSKEMLLGWALSYDADFIRSVINNCVLFGVC
jgi:hypothetical protein